MHHSFAPSVLLRRRDSVTWWAAHASKQPSDVIIHNTFIKAVRIYLACLKDCTLADLQASRT